MKREEIIHTFGAKKIAEVGVLRGRFASHLLSTNPEELHLIDPWRVFGKAVYPDHSQKTQEDWDKTHDFVQNKFSKDYRVNVHRGTSEEIASKFPDGYFDLVYIDANHTYEFCKLDIELWLPKVRKGGIIGGHDAVEALGVLRAWTEAFGKDNVRLTTEYNENTTHRKYPKSWFYKKK